MFKDSQKECSGICNVNIVPMARGEGTPYAKGRPATRQKNQKNTATNTLPLDFSNQKIPQSFQNIPRNNGDHCSCPREPLEKYDEHPRPLAMVVPPGPMAGYYCDADKLHVKEATHPPSCCR